MPASLHTLVYDRSVLKHLATIERKHHSAIRRSIEKMLSFEPTKESRNRKPLIRPSSLVDAWELRCGPDNRFRVFYRTDLESREVRVLAIGVKRGSRLFVGGKEFEL